MSDLYEIMSEKDAGYFARGANFLRTGMNGFREAVSAQHGGHAPGAVPHPQPPHAQAPVGGAAHAPSGAPVDHATGGGASTASADTASGTPAQGAEAPGPNPWATFRQGGSELLQRYAPGAAPWLQAHGPSMAAGGGLAALGYTAYRGGGAASEQEARMQDYLANAHHQMPQPMPSMAVYASYDAFAAEKKAALKTAAPIRTGFDPFGSAQSEFAKSFGSTLAQKLVAEPIDNFHRTLKKKIVDDPKAHDTFHSVIQGDDMLRDAYKANPERMEGTFKAMRKFGPSMSTSPEVVRSFLRQSTMAGGNMDFATVRLLAETEKFVQNSRGQGK